MRCKPNQVCIIVGAPRGLEDNIGALITTTSYEDGWNTGPNDPKFLWTWRDPSRPLLWELIWLRTKQPLRGKTSSCEFFPLPGRMFTMGLCDHHLLPYEPLQEPDADERKLPRYLFNDVKVTIDGQPA